MSRALPEWIGRNDDAAIPPRVRLRVFTRFAGRCQCGCNRPITVGESWDCDHAVALINGGAHRESNLVPLLTEHHKGKTKADVAEKSRTYERRLSHVGIKRSKPRWGYGRNDPLKKKINGKVVQRERRGRT